MKAAITVELDGSTFVLDQGAYDALRSYLDRAAARLGNHPDRNDVLAGLEHSIAAKLAQGPAAEGAPLDEGEMRAALKEVGRVDGPELGGAEPASNGAAGARDRGARGPETGRTRESAAGPSFGRAEAGPRKRRLYRLRDGQHIAGVCAGLAAFSEVDVGLIRFLFLIGTMFSGGMLLLGYVVLMFVMPIARTEAEVAEAHGGLPAS